MWVESLLSSHSLRVEIRFSLKLGLYTQLCNITVCRLPSWALSDTVHVPTPSEVIIRLSATLIHTLRVVSRWVKRDISFIQCMDAPESTTDLILFFLVDLGRSMGLHGGHTFMLCSSCTDLFITGGTPIGISAGTSLVIMQEAINRCLSMRASTLNFRGQVMGSHPCQKKQQAPLAHLPIRVTRRRWRSSAAAPPAV